MCDLCKEFDGVMYCQDCGRIICFDFKGTDDITAPAYITESGDLFCNVCGLQYDQYDCDYYPGPWDD